MKGRIHNIKEGLEQAIEVAKILNAVEILPDDAEPQIGDIITREYNGSILSPYIENEHMLRVNTESGKINKIIQRNGKPVIYQSQLKD